MSFQWPELLWGLALLPLLALFYAWLQRRRKRLALKYANLSLVRDALELATDDDIAGSIMRFADLRKRRSQLAVGGGLPKHIEARRVVPVA